MREKIEIREKGWKKDGKRMSSKREEKVSERKNYKGRDEQARGEVMNSKSGKIREREISVEQEHQKEEY